jgi:IclR family acetate operon transcriptional repressor
MVAVAVVDEASTRTADRSVAGRIFSIIDCVSAATDEISLANLARQTGIPKPSVSRIANQLVERRILGRGPYGYRLGLQLFEFGQRVSWHRVLRDTAIPFMEDLYEATHEIVYLGVLDGAEVLFVEQIAGHRAVFNDGPPGIRVPAFASSIGKAILAFAPNDVIDGALAAGLVKRAPRTITSQQMIREQLGEVRASRIAYDVEETRVGVCCVGAPILGRAGAGLAVAGPTYRFDLESWSRAVKTAAAAVSQALARDKLAYSHRQGL